MNPDSAAIKAVASKKGLALIIETDDGTWLLTATWDQIDAARLAVKATGEPQVLKMKSHTPEGEG